MDIPIEFRNTAPGVFDSVIDLNADQNIAVFGKNEAEDGCGGFLVFPRESAGQYYYITSYGPPTDFTQFGLVATDTDVELDVTLPEVQFLEVSFFCCIC